MTRSRSIRNHAVRGITPLLAAALLGVAAPAAANESTAASKPNMVVFYMDDFSPNAPGLWTDPERTPHLSRFVEEGTWFSTTSSSTPRCGPARANLLTGRWSHNNGVTDNDVEPYKPRQSVAGKLQDSGYHTLFGGKYINGLRRVAPQYEDVERYAANWDEFDAIWGNDGRFYDYRLWTNDGRKRYGERPRDHSTSVVTKRMVKHIRDAPRKRPLFSVLALYDGHEPNEPMPRFADDPRCADESWWGPAYNEEDVSDKPEAIQRLPLSELETYDLEARCQEILTVDWAVGRVMNALEQTGRLDDTVFVFTADNGWMMREHRVDTKKVPYSTPVPMYVLWPDRWADAPREIDEPISSVDLAPTFCDLGGCSIKRADGLSLLPLLDGEAEQLDRRFIYEESLHDKVVSAAWYGLRTTEAYDPDARWVYTEYKTGEKELYDLIADPDQLQNVSGVESYAEVEADLRAMLHDEVIEPDKVSYR